MKTFFKTVWFIAAAVMILTSCGELHDKDVEVFRTHINSQDPEIPDTYIAGNQVNDPFIYDEAIEVPRSYKNCDGETVHYTNIESQESVHENSYTEQGKEISAQEILDRAGIPGEVDGKDVEITIIDPERDKISDRCDDCDEVSTAWWAGTFCCLPLWLILAILIAILVFLILSWRRLGEMISTMRGMRATPSGGTPAAPAGTRTMWDPNNTLASDEKRLKKRDITADENGNVINVKEEYFDDNKSS